ncbi:acyltransferase family protein [Haloplasma contractile]|uniref:Acyltransferase domain containing protein n=1 Tax=Haloplasma contractile SSD-17B TaxID=1033810 RepID=U2FQ68_9MOLU|nr:acyltransferase family protein [Haloplasma contractile]ERJ13189.1 Acyltransferase domain containing protein [Haloplasma contractile SSD-17B]
MILDVKFLDDTGPLWFAATLLVFSVIYASYKALNIHIVSISSFKKLTPNFTILYLIVVVSYFTYIVRLRYPIGTHFYNFQLSFFTQYIVLFIVGILIRRLNLLNKLTYKFGLTWFAFGIFVSLTLFGAISYFGGAVDNPYLLLGGHSSQAALYALWESITCASIILGLLVLFKRFFNKSTKFTLFLSQNAFGVYVLHAPILVFISLHLVVYKFNPTTKSFILFILGLVCSFIASYLIRKIKILKLILS